MSGGFEIVTLETKSLGDRSYVVVSEGQAAVIDPQRDLDRVEGILTDHGARLTHVFETHVHNDYVTGGAALAAKHDAVYVIAAEDEIDPPHVGAREGDEYEVGGVVFRAVHTPGHTPTHLSWVLVDGGEPAAVFTGGSMLFGSVGRTDLIDDESTEALTRAQYRSVRRLAAELPPEATVHPTHGFGSFCSSGSTSGSDESTVGQEQKSNAALTTDDEDRFVAELLGGLTAYPRYYAHMAPLNRRGPDEADLAPPSEVDPAEIRRRIHAGEWVVDLRSRKAFADGHVAGTINVEVGDSFVTYLGWTIPWGTPVTLVGDTADEVAEAQRQLTRIGIDRPAGGADGGPGSWGAGSEISRYRSATFAELAGEIGRGDTVVLDVRRDDERAEGHIEGSRHIRLDQLEDRMDEVPDGREVWVHCASGYRASIAASLLDRAGKRVVAIHDDWEASGPAGLSTASSPS